MDNKKHHCFNCGAETEDWDSAPNGNKIYVCDDPKCIKEHRYQMAAAENEKRWRAEDDNYDRY